MTFFVECVSNTFTIKQDEKTFFLPTSSGTIALINDIHNLSSIEFSGSELSLGMNGITNPITATIPNATTTNAVVVSIVEQSILSTKTFNNGISLDDLEDDAFNIALVVK
jgi:hypothetical protein